MASPRTWPQPAPLLSIIVPVYNEAETVGQVLRRLVTGLEAPKEILVVDDGSTDNTPAVLEEWAGAPGVLLFRHPQNRGKGAAIRTALPHARGAFTIIQDADLEYDPRWIPSLLEPLRRGQAHVVYGSRYLSPGAPLPWSKFRVAVVLLNSLVRVLYGRRFTDEATCYKAFPTPLLRALDLRSNRFEICPEMTAKVCRLGLTVLELPIGYTPRGRADGKKIGWRDAWQAAWALLRWRLTPLTWGRGPGRPAARPRPPLEQEVMA